MNLFNGGNSSTEGRSTQNGVSPKVELSSRIASDDLLYTSAAKGFRPGGPNGSFSSSLCGADLQRLGISGVPSQYQSDNLWTYELGSKNQFLDHKLTVNAAGYYTDWKNIQQTILLPSCGFAYTGNVGAATVKGLELSAQEQLISGLVAGAGVNYADAQITRSAPGVSAQVGQQVLGSPKWSGNAFLAYSFPLGTTHVQMRADYQYHDSQLRDFAATFTSIAANGSPELVANFNQRVAAYSLVNLNFSLRHRNWEGSLFANNLLNTHPVIDFNPTNTFTQAYSVRPRTIGLSVRTHL